MPGKVYVNRTLNLKRIKYIGLDMDHTLIRYNIENFERLSHSMIIDKLVTSKGYPETIRNLQFVYGHAIRGLVVDRKTGNLLKLNRYAAIRAAVHGLKPIDFKTQQAMYKSTYIDLSQGDYMAVDTFFSLSLAILYAQLVDAKDSQPLVHFPEYAQMADDVLMGLDEIHRDGSLKGVVAKSLDQFIEKDEALVAGLEKFKKHGKKIFILTNSDFHYTKLLLDYAINPYLKEHKHWSELFELIITFAAKPRFFYEKGTKFLRVNPNDGSMTNWSESLKPGIYQGGCAQLFTDELRLDGDEILYIGDHIYGDIVRLKKDCNWRTAMVIDELDNELDNNQLAAPVNLEIEELMRKKEPLEDKLTALMTARIDKNITTSEQEIDTLLKSIAELDTQISSKIKKQLSFYNPVWGPLMRAGNEESYFAYQLDRYGCVYMSKLGDLFALSPRTYFRAPRRLLAHEYL